MAPEPFDFVAFDPPEVEFSGNVVDSADEPGKRVSQGSIEVEDDQSVSVVRFQ
ncbi:hypothetical protein D3C87_1571530 [compost metagenome]